MNLFSSLFHCSASPNALTSFCAKRFLTTAEMRSFRLKLFQDEKCRQEVLRSRCSIEKISVSVKGPPEEVKLEMNKNFSTPLHCTRHINDLLTYRSALGLVDGNELCSMNKALTRDCELHFLHCKDEDSRALNKCFWRSAAFLLGSAIEKAFKDEMCVRLHSWMPLDVDSGFFAYDLELPFLDWKPSLEEMRSLNRAVATFYWHLEHFEPLSVDASVAKNIFTHNPYKLEQIDELAAKSKSGHTISLYKVFDHVDMSCGEMVSHTQLFGRFNITCVHQLYPVSQKSGMYRIQAVALPIDLTLHQWTWNLLMKRAAIKHATYPPSQPRITLPDPEIVVPSNRGWILLHEREGKPLNTLWHSLKHGDHYENTSVRFDRRSWRYTHAPEVKPSNPSIWTVGKRKEPAEFVRANNKTVPH